MDVPLLRLPLPLLHVSCSASHMLRGNSAACNSQAAAQPPAKVYKPPERTMEQTTAGRAVLHRARVYTAALEKELGAELVREQRRQELEEAAARKSDAAATAEAARQQLIQRGKAVTAARLQAVELAREAQEAARQAELSERAERRLARLAEQHAEQEEERRRASQAAERRRGDNKAYVEARHGQRLAATAAGVREREASAAARLAALDATVQHVIGQRQQQWEQTMGRCAAVPRPCPSAATERPPSRRCLTGTRGRRRPSRSTARASARR